jgi:hypothetical protein
MTSIDYEVLMVNTRIFVFLDKNKEKLKKSEINNFKKLYFSVISSVFISYGVNLALIETEFF